MDRVIVGSHFPPATTSAVSGGNLAIHPGKPAVVFGTVSGPKKPIELSYVLVFRYRPGSDSFSFTKRESNANSSSGGECKNALHSRRQTGRGKTSGTN